MHQQVELSSVLS